MLGKTIGIVGFGNIGKKISEISHAYGMNVLVHSASLSDTEQKKYKVEKVPFEEILLHSDIITFHNKLSDKSKYMIINSSNKYKINVYNIPKNKWIDIGNFTELNKVSGNPYYTALVWTTTFYTRPIITLGFSRNYLSGGLPTDRPFTIWDAALLPFEALFMDTKIKNYLQIKF